MDADWEGSYGMRYTGIGRVKLINEAQEADRWLDALNLSPRLPGENFVEWDRRTNGGKDVGHLAIKQSVDLAIGEEHGTN